MREAGPGTEHVLAMASPGFDVLTGIVGLGGAARGGNNAATERRSDREESPGLINTFSKGDNS